LGKKLVDTDWIEWLKKTSIFLLKKSPNIILRSCSDLAEEYTELGLELYNISFFYFWEILLDEQKKNLIDNLKKILLSNPKPFLLVRKTILNLAEFMNRKKCSFEINSSLLADSARDSSAYAKHLYYR
jgi:FKBP12-rapamycin complex-associated protein